MNELARALELTLPATRVLWSRGYRDLDAARKFLHPSVGDLHDPSLMKDMSVAAGRLWSAIQAKEAILLYGDYDVDGTTSVVLLKKSIELLGGRADFHVPHRLRDGYGMRSEVVEQAASSGVTLIVSVDTGIRANEVVKRANALGIDVIVTDHHLPEEEIPPALAVLNPNRPDCEYPEKNLCGAGVVLKLVQALLARSGWDVARREKLLDSFLKMTAIATVADVVPLTGENRVIVKRGLEGLDRISNPGLRALLEVSGIKEGQIPSARDVAFRVAPRINAAGRMASATDVIEMFLTGDPSRAKDLASKLHDLNTDRQQTEAEMVKAIFDLCIEQPVTDDDAALVFAGEGWHRGVVGIVASRVVERFHRPAFVLGIENGVVTGSGRSIAVFHLLEALESMQDLFTKFGGHRQAAGLTLAADRLEEFRERFRIYAAARLTPRDFERELFIDSTIRFDEIDDRSVDDILRLAPFGQGNPPPVFASFGVEAAFPPTVNKEKHLFLKLRGDGRTVRMKAWNFADREALFAPGSKVDIAFTFEDDTYSAERGYAPWQAVVKDVRASESERRHIEACGKP